MKNILAFTGLMMLAVFVSAQDNIVLKTGEEIKAKVLEVGTSEIKYKKVDNPNGPLYTTGKNEVLMIKYENGSKDVFSSTTPSGDNQHGFSQCPVTGKGEPMSDYDKYRRLSRKKTVAGAIMTGLGVHALVGGGALIIGGLTQFNEPSGGPGMNLGGPVLAGLGLVSAGLGTALTIVGAINLSKGTKYRKMAKQAQPPTLGFAPIQNPALDRLQQGMYGQTIGSVTFTF